MKVCTIGVDETQALAKQFLNELKLRVQTPKLKAMVVGLRGDLGAGKTTLVQGIARELGITEHVTSPTFILMRRFKIDDSQFTNLIHIDAYRLESEQELKHLGWDELLADPDNLILIEWPEKVEDALPEETLYIDCKHIDELCREISW